MAAWCMAQAVLRVWVDSPTEQDVSDAIRIYGKVESTIKVGSTFLGMPEMLSWWERLI
jgi:hypothetical protein